MRRPDLAAITLDPRGGGIATAARLFWQVMTSRWGAGCRLFTLVDSPARSIVPGVAARVGFGAALAAEQILGRCAWIFYSHLGLARVQAFVPPAARRPYIVFLHGIEAWKTLPAAEQRSLAGAALRIANSEFTARRVREANPGIGEIVICPLALPQTSIAGPPAEIRDHMRLSVLTVARMSAAERYKGHDALLEAWPAVVSRHPRAQLIFVGEGDDVARLRQKASALGVTDRVVFTGFVREEDLRACYAAAAVFAMPSRGEGFGLAYLEAMAHGLPCIGSCHDAAGEVIEDGLTGSLVDQADIATLAGRLGDLLGDETRRREWGARGRRRFEQHFTVERFAERLLPYLDPGPSERSATARTPVGVRPDSI